MDARRLIFVVGAAALLITTACGPEPTPLPVVPPTYTPLPQSLNAPLPVPQDNMVQYVADPIAAEIAAVAFENISEMPVIYVLPTPQLSGAPSEIVLSSRSFEGSQILPDQFLFGIALTETISPLDTPQIRQLLVEYLRLLAAEQQENVLLVEMQHLIRQSLANIGYPDGVRINVNYLIPSLAQDFTAAGIELVEISGQPSQLRVVFGVAQRELAAVEYGETNVVYGFSLPLYFAANPGLQLTIGSSGLPELVNDP